MFDKVGGFNRWSLFVGKISIIKPIKLQKRMPVFVSVPASKALWKKEF